MSTPDKDDPNMIHINNMRYGFGDITNNSKIYVCQGRCDLATYYPIQNKLIIRNNGISLKIDVTDNAYIKTNMNDDDNKYKLESIVLLSPARHQLHGIQYPFEVCFIHSLKMNKPDSNNDIIDDINNDNNKQYIIFSVLAKTATATKNCPSTDKSCTDEKFFQFFKAIADKGLQVKYKDNTQIDNIIEYDINDILPGKNKQSFYTYARKNIKWIIFDKIMIMPTNLQVQYIKYVCKENTYSETLNFLSKKKSRNALVGTVGFYKRDLTNGGGGEELDKDLKLKCKKICPNPPPKPPKPPPKPPKCFHNDDDNNNFMESESIPEKLSTSNLEYKEPVDDKVIEKLTNENSIKGVLRYFIAELAITLTIFLIYTIFYFTYPGFKKSNRREMGILVSIYCICNIILIALSIKKIKNNHIYKLNSTIQSIINFLFPIFFILYFITVAYIISTYGSSDHIIRIFTIGSIFLLNIYIYLYSLTITDETYKKIIITIIITLIIMASILCSFTFGKIIKNKNTIVPTDNSNGVELSDPIDNSNGVESTGPNDTSNGSINYGKDVNTLGLIESSING